MSQHDTLTLREALRSIQYEAASLADAQVIALQALNATYPARAALSATQPAQAAQSAPVGYAGYTSVQGFTAAFFPAEKIPEGTPLYIALLPAAGADVLDGKRWRYAIADGGNQSMNFLDIYDDWDGDGAFVDAFDKAMNSDAAIAASGRHE